MDWFNLTCLHACVWNFKVDFAAKQNWNLCCTFICAHEVNTTVNMYVLYCNKIWGKIMLWKSKYWIFSSRLSVTLSCPLDLTLFPMDTQRCKMQLESCEYFYFSPLFTSVPSSSKHVLSKAHEGREKVQFDTWHSCSGSCIGCVFQTCIYVLCSLQWLEYVFVQLATPQMTCSSCGRLETLCKWMKLLYRNLTSGRKILIMETAPSTMQEQVQPFSDIHQRQHLKCCQIYCSMKGCEQSTNVIFFIFSIKCSFSG